MRDIAIDLGSANTLVYTKEKGIILREPSVMAVDRRNNEVLAVGSEAKEMLGRTPELITAVRPLRNGVITDIDMAAAMLGRMLRKVIKASFFVRPKAVVCVPSGCTEMERSAVEEAVRQSGAGQVELMEEPMAAAIGAGLPVKGAEGCMVVDIGGGTTEAAVISRQELVVSRSVRVAGDALDEAVVRFVRQKYSLLIGDSTAEQLKRQIGSVCPYDKEESMKVKGRVLGSGLPGEAVVTAADIREAVGETVSVMLECVRAALEATPPELCADLTDSGMILTGGGALLRGLDKLLARETGVQVRMAEEPLDCVVKGAAKRCRG